MAVVVVVAAVVVVIVDVVAVVAVDIGVFECMLLGLLLVDIVVETMVVQALLVLVDKVVEDSNCCPECCK